MCCLINFLEMSAFSTCFRVCHLFSTLFIHPFCQLQIITTVESQLSVLWLHNIAIVHVLCNILVIPTAVCLSLRNILHSRRSFPPLLAYPPPPACPTFTLPSLSLPPMCVCIFPLLAPSHTSSVQLSSSWLPVVCWFFASLQQSRIPICTACA